MKKFKEFLEDYKEPMLFFAISALTVTTAVYFVKYVSEVAAFEQVALAAEDLGIIEQLTEHLKTNGPFFPKD